MNTKSDTLHPSTSAASTKENAARVLVDNAIGAAAYLIDRFANSLDFYWNIESAILERWMQESYPEVVGKMQTEGVYEEFRVRLDTYRKQLKDAAFSVSVIENLGCDDVLENDGMDCHRIFSGLVARISSGSIRALDEKTLLAALLVDKHCRNVRDGFDNPILSSASHSKIRVPERTWDWCDISAVKANTRNDVAFLLARKHFPLSLARQTDEEFALIVQVRSGTDLSSLVKPSGIHTVNISIDADSSERSLTFSSLPLCIPMVANEEILNLFRNHLPVLYLHNEGGLLVEYPWTPVTDFVKCLYPHIHMDLPPEWDDESYELVDFKAAHPHATRISEIRPMPLLTGPYISWHQRYRLLSGSEEIPF